MEEGLVHRFVNNYTNRAGCASECAGCRSCESRCPFGVPIAERMEKTAKLFGC